MECINGNGPCPNGCDCGCDSGTYECWCNMAYDSPDSEDYRNDRMALQGYVPIGDGQYRKEG